MLAGYSTILCTKASKLQMYKVFIRVTEITLTPNLAACPKPGHLNCQLEGITYNILLRGKSSFTKSWLILKHSLEDGSSLIQMNTPNKIISLFILQEATVTVTNGIQISRSN